MIYYIPIIITIVANVLYHILQKSTPSGVNPFISLTATYVTAAILCLTLAPLYSSGEGLVASFKALNWVSYALGAAIIGLEIGFLLAYRADWDISKAALISNSAVTLLLIPIGLLFFRERITFVNIAGIALCVTGLLMINQK